jgi:hypothetical protein
MVAMVEPPGLAQRAFARGSVGWRGPRIVFVDRRPFALVVYFHSWTSVVCVRQFLCGFRGFGRHCGPNKPNLSVEVR